MTRGAAAEPSAAVRPVVIGDRRRVVASLAAGFADDPAMCFIYPDARQRRRHLPRLLTMLYDSATGLRLTSDGHEAATLWRSPDAVDHAQRSGWRDRIGAWWIFGEALSRAQRLGGAIEAHFPAGRFWYLNIAGCAPGMQGRGLGAAVVRAGLDRIDGSPAYLETATERNLGFYRQFGFEVIDRWDVPGGGPTFWSMWREATSSTTI